MSVVELSLFLMLLLFAVLGSGVWIALALAVCGFVAILTKMSTPAGQVLATSVWAASDSWDLTALPMFIWMGEILYRTKLSDDMFEGLAPWVQKLPGRLLHVNVIGCAIFAAVSGSSAATCATIGRIALPELLKRGYDEKMAVGTLAGSGTLGLLIPPSIIMIVYATATDQSIARLFIAGVLPGLMLTGLFMLWSMFAIWRRGFRSHAPDFRYSWKEKFVSIPKIAPFLFIIGGVMYTLYGGVATPSEAAGVGAALCLILAVIIYRLYQPAQIWQILRDTMRESVMILTIIAAAVLFGYMLTSLYLTQTLAQAIADAHFNRWVLMFMINLFLLVCGFFIPPAAIILMTSPILLPIIRAVGFDPVWFGVIVTINMEIGLIHPPVGLNIYIVNAIAPDVPVTKVMWGTLPYVVCMMLAIVILCIFPEIATWLPNHLMGAGK